MRETWHVTARELRRSLRLSLRAFQASVPLFDRPLLTFLYRPGFLLTSDRAESSPHFRSIARPIAEPQLLD